MKWEYCVVTANELKGGLKEANEKGAEGWELVSVTGIIGQESTSGGHYISATKGYCFFFKRPIDNK
ncbi:hypothetical protein KKG08_02610 [Patescibacteria group bacterium]|nr:hypothetical protein [Patescibacteria group bacterium]